MKTMLFQLDPQFDQGVVKAAVAESDDRNGQGTVPFEQRLDRRQDLVGDSARIDRRSEDD